jgi:archaellum component FlaC
MQPEETRKINKLVTDVEELSKTVNTFMRESETYDVGVGKDIEQIKKDIGEIKALINNNYVRREEFNPVQKVVYGLVSIILMTVIGAMIALVLR